MKCKWCGSVMDLKEEFDSKPDLDFNTFHVWVYKCPECGESEEDYLQTN